MQTSGNKIYGHNSLGFMRNPIVWLSLILLGLSSPGISLANNFIAPWKEKDQALVLDAYERNPIDWKEVVKDRKIRAFIGKSSDGLPPSYRCPMKDETAVTLCKKTFQNYWLKRELYHTRKAAAKNLGLKWGAYHLGRPGNPIEQANHFIDFADPQPDDFIALDIEHDDPEKWISFRDAEIFARHIKARLGRYPVLYTNHITAKSIAAKRKKYPLLSRLPLWYARYKDNIQGVFPIGNWDNYALWQFSSHVNCNKRRCLYRVDGTQNDIDVNASGLTIAQFEKAWPFNELVQRNSGREKKPETVVAKVTEPLSVTRFKVNYSVDLGKRKKTKLTSVAVPTPRERMALLDTVETASVEDVPVSGTLASASSVALKEEQLGFGSVSTFMAAFLPHEAQPEYVPIRYGYTSHDSNYGESVHQNERYLR
ncbi:MAG: glycoside hydrolase family 25 protein [Rhizobiaceae bacterium]